MDTPSQQNLNQLPIGTVLGDFKITGIVGEGGFGIVYLAYESTLDRTVAIKEYLPSSIAGRTGNQSVMVRSQLNTNAYASGLKNFLREAQLLARFSHPAMVEVHRVWEQNSTAYMAMRFYDGKTLRELRQGTATFDELYIRRLMEPIFDAVALLHAQNVIHRDVSPDNILMRGNGAPVLLDLGAARLVIGGMTQALTTILKPGYAPIEQYVDDGTMRQGPWTDVYGLGAVLYYLLTGVAPPQAVARMITDPLRKTLLAALQIPVAPYFIDAVVKALAVRPDDRYQSVDELRDALDWMDPLPVEPRTTYVRVDAPNVSAAVAGAVASSAATRLSIEPLLPTAVVKTAAPTAPVASLASLGLPPVSVVPVAPVASVAPFEFVTSAPAPAVDSEATIVWQPGAVNEALTAAAPAYVPAPSSAPTPIPVAAPVARAITAPAPQRAPATAPAAIPEPVPVAAPIGRAKAYGDSESSGSKVWIFAALAALIAAVAGFMVLNRPAKEVPPPPAVAASEPAPSAPPVSAPIVIAPAAEPPKSEPVPLPVAAKVAPDVTKPLPELKAKDTPRPEDDKLAQALAKRDAEEKAKAKADALALAAKAKADAAEERAKARAKTEAEERAATYARTEADERARRARLEEEERQAAAAKARQEVERQAKAPAMVTTPSGLTVAAPKRTVEELSAAGKAAFSRGEVGAARAAWTELVNHPEAQPRSKAITYNNLAVSYCQGGDEAGCERMYAAMFRADRAYGAEVGERELPLFKRAYDRAARSAR